MIGLCRLDRKARAELATQLTYAMLGLLYESDYYLPDGPSENEIYDWLLAAIERLAVKGR